MNFSPQINPGIPPLKIAGREPQFSVFSPKKIVASSQPVRDRITGMGIKADELEQKIQEFEAQTLNDVAYNNLKQA